MDSGAKDGEITCVIADVHANLSALEAVLRDARDHGASSYLFLGDAVGYGPEPARCVQRLAELPRAVHIRGNHDHAVASDESDPEMSWLARVSANWTRSVLGRDELCWLGTLPVEHAEEHWLAVHGAPRDPHRFREYVREPSSEENLRCLRERGIAVCFHGHTHFQVTYAERFPRPVVLSGQRPILLAKSRTWLVNPGSVGQPRDGDPRAGYALWNRRTGELATRRVPYDVAATVDAIRSAHLPERLAARLQHGM